MFYQTLIPVAHTRDGIAMTIERLIDMLDTIDGDPDMDACVTDDAHDWTELEQCVSDEPHDSEGNDWIRGGQGA